MTKILDQSLEASLINSAQNGHSDAFGQLYDAYIKKIYDFIFYKTMHQAVAEDISSAVFLKAWKNIKQFRGGSWSAWLYATARHAVIDYYRQSTNIIDIEDCWDLADKQNLLIEVDNSLKINQIKQAMKKLSASDREIIIMRLWLDLPFADIAEKLQKKEGAVKMAFSRSLLRLKNEVSFMALFLGPIISKALNKLYE